MKVFSNSNYNADFIFDELMTGSGVVIIEDVYDMNVINSAKEIINNLADTQGQKESHFNAEAEGLKIEDILIQLLGAITE